jgi:predicted nuclease of predicted toxin-antitoxin system
VAGDRQVRRDPHSGPARGDRTSDEQITLKADQEHRIVVTKDADFVDAHLLRGHPARLLLISMGNMSNRELEALMLPLLPEMAREFGAHASLELGRSAIAVRG